jgi:hypothetical protein
VRTIEFEALCQNSGKKVGHMFSSIHTDVLLSWLVSGVSWASRLANGI